VILSGDVGTHNNALNAVAAVSSGDVWSVGSYYSGTQQTLAEHWDGSTWSLVSSPNLGTGSYLNGVAAISGSDVWAVGYYNNGTVNQTLVEHWNGAQWSVVSSPNLGTSSNYLFGVTGVSVGDVWAVGNYINVNTIRTLVEHWNGTQWSVVTSPNIGISYNYLNGVAAISGSDVWAVGYYINGTVHNTLVEHWNGTLWSVVSSPNLGTNSNYLNGVAAVSAGDVWAVGNYYNGPTVQTLVEHWNGSTWSVVPSPNVGTNNNVLIGVTGVSGGDVWAVGNYYNGTVYNTLVEHWNGTQWSVVNSPNVGTNNNFLDGVAAVSAGDVWAVGYQSSPYQTLVERYNPCMPSPTPTPTPTSCSIQYTDVPVGSTFYPYIHCLACRGIVSGYPDGTFKPNNPVTRGQLSKIVSNSAGYSETHSEATFQDVPVGTTFYQYIERLATRGFVSGYACGGAGEPCVPPGDLPYFRPNANVTRGQTAKIVASAKGLPSPPPGRHTFQDVPVGSTFWQWIEALVDAGAISGYSCGGVGEPCVPPGNLPYFRPNNGVTRGQSTKIVGNTFFPNCQTPRPPAGAPSAYSRSIVGKEGVQGCMGAPLTGVGCPPIFFPSPTGWLKVHQLLNSNVLTQACAPRTVYPAGVRAWTATLDNQSGGRGNEGYCQ
jgi:hypothetical protein